MISYFEEDFVQLKKKSEQLGKLVDKVVYIHDLENFSLSRNTDRKVFSTVIFFINLYANNYPETLKTAYVINAPVYFTIFYSMLKTVIPSKVIQKIKVYSDNSWKEDFLNIIDAEVLPAFLGGTRTDTDGNPLCNEFINRAGLVPEIYHLHKRKQSFSTPLDSQTIKVPRNSSHDIILGVKESGSYLEWEFQVKSGDIKFGLCFQNNETERTVLIPLEKKNTDECTERGAYKCDKTGSYIVQFDNTHSYLRLKEVYYIINVKSPEEVASDLIN